MRPWPACSGQSVPPGQHQVQDDKVEDLGIRAKEAVLTGCRNHDVVVLRPQRRLDDLREFSFVFDDQDTHEPECYRRRFATSLTFV